MGKFQAIGNYKGRNFDPAFRMANSGHSPHIVYDPSTRPALSCKEKLDRVDAVETTRRTPGEWDRLPFRQGRLPREWGRLPIRHERPSGARDKLPTPRANERTSPSALSSAPNPRATAPPPPRNSTVPEAAVAPTTLTPRAVEVDENFELTGKPRRIEKQFPVTFSGNLEMMSAVTSNISQYLSTIIEWLSLAPKEQPSVSQNAIKRMESAQASTTRELDYYNQIHCRLINIVEPRMQVEFIQEAQKMIRDTRNAWILPCMKIVDTAQSETEQGQGANPVLVTTPTLMWLCNPTVDRAKNPESSTTPTPSSTQTSLAIDTSQATAAAAKRKAHHLDQSGISPHKRKQDEGEDETAEMILTADINASSPVDIEGESQPGIAPPAVVVAKEAVSADIASTVDTARETIPWQQSQRTEITNSPIDTSLAQLSASLDPVQEESATTKEAIVNTRGDTPIPNEGSPSVSESTNAVLFDTSSVISTPTRVSKEKDVSREMSASGRSESVTATSKESKESEPSNLNQHDLSTKEDAVISRTGTAGTVSNTESLRSISSSVKSAGKAELVASLSAVAVEPTPRNHLTFQQELALLREEAREQRARTDQMMLLLRNEATQRHQAEQRLADMAAQLQEQGMKALKRDLEAKRAEAMTMMYKAQVDMREASVIVSRAGEERAEALYKAARTEAENEKLLRRIKEMEHRHSGSELNGLTEPLQPKDVAATMETAEVLFSDRESESQQVITDFSYNEDHTGESPHKCNSQTVKTTAGDEAGLEVSSSK